LNSCQLLYAKYTITPSQHTNGAPSASPWNMRAGSHADKVKTLSESEVDSDMDVNFEAAILDKMLQVAVTAKLKLDEVPDLITF